MSIPSLPPSANSEDEGEEEHQQPSHHPFAPADELFDISTTVDPSYVIALIRKLIPANFKSDDKPQGLDAYDAPIEILRKEGVSETPSALSENGILHSSDSGTDDIVPVNQFGQSYGLEARDNGHHHCQYQGRLMEEEAWEEFGCILWDLAASKTNAELMVQNLILEVLLATLKISQSARITEISLGIIGNLACHEISRLQISSANGLVEAIVNHLFLDDTSCLGETCRLLTLCVQGSEGVIWAEALQAQHILSRILWIAENALNPQLIEKSVGLLLAILETQPEITSILVPPLMKLGLSSLLIDLLTFEMNELRNKRMPERYPALDMILRAIEVLSVDDYSSEICSKKELFEQLNYLIKLPDKIEVSNACICAAVLIANILTEAPDLASELSEDLVFLQGLLDIFPFASDDIEARSAIWSVIASLLAKVQKREMNLSSLIGYVSTFVNNTYLIEELIDHQSDGAKAAKRNARPIALKCMFDILSHWSALKNQAEKRDIRMNQVDFDKLLDHCSKYSNFSAE